MFFKVASFFGDMKSAILEANTDYEIEALRARRVQVYVHDEP